MTGTKSQPNFERQLIGLAVAACFAGVVHANPTGPAVANGAASFATTGNTLTVTNTPGAIINWQAFSIRPDEVTRFIQSGAASAVLNRVTGVGQSAILGQLLSNGRVFLINPNGVVVGAGARIDTAGFVASSLNLSNEDFLAGRFRFADPGNAGKVTNAGSINAHSGGPVYLIAPTVENHGVITAPNGDILLAAGKSVELVSAASPHLRVQVQAGGEAVNVGQLLADSGRVGLYGAAIRNAGTISADSASLNAAGNVVLKASRDVTLEGTSVVSASGAKGGTVEMQAEQGTLLVDGRVDAKGAAGQGGDVRLLGTQVGLIGNAAVDASGAKGGGTVLVGGDYQGKNPDIQNAARVVLAPDAKVVADATGRGDGGRVIVWSDEYTGFYGTISARGGAAGGNGGFVETSSKDNLQALGIVDAAAPLGRAGEWLLDPANVTISGGVTANGVYSGGSPNLFTTTANNAVANVTTLQTSLNAGTSVTINTTPGGAQAGTITLAAATPITKSAGGNAALTLNAQSNIVLNSGISSTSNTLDVNLNAGLAGAGTVTLNNMSLNGGTLTVNAPGAVTQTAATTLQAATSVVKQGAGTMTLSQANTYTGTTNVQTGTLTVTNASGLGTVAGGTTVGAGATLNISNVAVGAEAVTLNGTLQGTGAGASLAGTVALGAASAVNTAAAADTLTVSGVVSGANALTKNGAGTLTLSGANTYAGATTINAGTVVASNATALGTTAGGTTVVAGATLRVNNIAIGTETLTLNGAGVGGAGALQGTGAGAALAGSVTLGSATTVGATAAADTLTLSGAVGGANALTKVGAGSVTLSGANTYTGATAINAGTVVASNAAALGTTAGGTTVANGATLRVNNVAIGAEAVTLNGTGVGAAGALQGTGTASLAGNVTLAIASSVGVTAAADTLTLSGVVSGANALTKVGAGTAVLSGANTYTGATTISAGTVVASNTAALGTTAGGTTVANGATLRVNNVAIGAEAVTLNGIGVGAAGALQGAGTASLAGNVTLAAASTVGVTGAADALTLSGVVSGANALTKAGAGTLTLSGANIYTGATTINAGTVVASNATALGTVAGGATVAAGATLNVNNVAIGAEAVTLNGTLQGTGAASLSGTVALGAASALNTAALGDTLTLTGVVSGANALNKNGAGTVVLGGAAANTYTGATNVNAGTLRVGSAANKITNTSAVNVAAPGTLDLNNFNETVGSIAGAGNITLGSATLTAGNATNTLFSGVVSGTGGLTKAGTGTLELSGANTYTGTTAISAGTVVASNVTALGTTAGGTTVANGATLRINNVAIGAEAVTVNGAGVGAAGALQGTGTASLAGNVALATASTVGAAAAADTLTLSGVVSGANALTKAGAGTVVLTGANTYTGATTINAGTVVASNATALGTVAGGTTVAAGATLNINNVAIGTEALTLNGTLRGTGAASLAGTVALGAANALNTAAAGDTLTLTGVVSGANALNKNGAGTVVLAGAANNTYTGVTNINAGTLVASKAGALGTVAGGTTVANGATLQISNVAIGAEPVALNGAGVGGSGALQGTGVASLTGNVTLASASSIGAPALADTLTLSGVVGGANDLTKVGAGTVVLSGAAANTYGGATNVNAGTLRVGSAANKITDTSAVTVAGGATLDLNGFGETIGSLAGAGNVTLGAGTLTAGGNGASTVFSGVVSGAGGLTKAGAGTLELSGANTYAGATNVNAGTLTASNAAALGTTAGATSVANGATLNINNVAIGNEAVTINGNGVGGAGALTGTGTASLGGQVAVATASRVGAAPGSALALNGTVQGPGALDVAGGGSVTFGNTVGNLTPLASLTSAAGTALNVNGGLVRTTGTQTYNGSLTTGAPTTLQTTNANVTANGAVTATAGTLTLNTGTGNVSMTNAANDFGTVSVTSGNTVALNDVNALALGASSVSTITATAGGALNVNGALTASGGGNSIVLSGTSFVNNVGAGALIVPVGGRWVVYSADPAGDTFNGLASGNQAIWNATFAGSPPGTIPAGNRYVFSMTGTPATLTFTSTDAAKVYGDVANVSGNYAVSGFVNAATYGNVFTQDTAANTFTGAPNVTSAGAPAIANVGLYPITVTTGTLAATTGYTFALNAAGQLTVSARPITVTPGPLARPYGDPNPTTTGTLTVGGSGLANGNTITQVDVASPATATDPAGSAHALNASNAAFGGGGVASNYVITYAPGTLTISQRPISVLASDQARAYGDPNPTTGPFTITVGSLAGTDAIGSVNVTSPALSTSPAGSAWVLTNTGTNFTSGSASNYAITLQNGQLTIAQRPIAVKANDQNRAYGDPNPATGPFTITAGSLAGTDAIGSVNVTSPALSSSPAGGVWVLTNTGTNFTTGTAANYAITLQNGQLTIDPRAITVQANNQGRAYGDPNPTSGPYTITAGSLAGADSITNVNVTSPALVTSPVGPYALTPTAANFGTGAATNYAITFVDGVLTITPRPITVTANNQAKVYGQPDPALTFTAPTVNGDVLAGTPIRVPGETVAGGPYAITQGTVTNANNPNYTITFVNGQIVITPAALTIAADNKARLYGDANPPLTATFTGLTNGDTPAAIPAVTLTTPATLASNTGGYAINVASGANANYAITYVNGQLVITPAPLTIAANDASRLEGQPNPPFTAAYTGLKLGQTPAALGGALAFSTPATLASPPGPYAITPLGQTSTNYTITYVDGVLTVTPLPVVPVPPVVSGVAAADNALITATQRSADAEDVAPRLPEAKGVDCLVLERPAIRRVLNRCY